MAIEIDELRIRMTVGTDPGRAGTGADGSRGVLGEAERARLLTDCVEHVLEILRDREER